MNPSTLPGPSRGAAVVRRRDAALWCLGFGLLLLGCVFDAEVAAAVRVWATSTAFNHCFLVIPIAAYLAWDRRRELAGLIPQPRPRTALLGLPVAVLWLAAERLGLMEGRQLAAMTFVQVLLLALLGGRLFRALLGPLLYLYFLVPSGAFLTPALQDVTTWFIRHGLRLLGVPAFVDGHVIEIPQGTFFVAEACAGLRFLIASVAFGWLYALLMYRGPGRRAGFVIVSALMPVLANGGRALGIVYLGFLLGSAEAAAADHVVYGWAFFSFVVLLLIVCGLPFRQDAGATRSATRSPAEQTSTERGASPGGRAAPDELGADAGPPAVAPQAALASSRVKRAGTARRRVRPWPSRPAAARDGVSPPDRHGNRFPVVAMAATMATVAVAAGMPAITAALPAAAPSPTSTVAIDAGPDCRARPVASAVAAAGTSRVVCGDVAMDVVWQVFPPRVTAAPVLAARSRRSQHAETESLSESWLSGSSPWRIAASSSPFHLAATAIWIDGAPARPGLAMRARMAIDSLLGASPSPVLVTVTPAPAREDAAPATLAAAEPVLRSFLLSHPRLATSLVASSIRQPVLPAR